MRKKVLGSVLAALALCTAMVMPALAEDQQLDNVTNWGDTEVDATIVDSAGEVAYIVTVPTKIDFGKLICPDTDVDSYVTQKFTMACTQMQGVNSVTLYAYNDGSMAGEANQKFFLTNQTKPSCGFMPEYDLGVATERIDVTGVMDKNGYKYVVFTAEGQTIAGGVRLNQNQIYDEIYNKNRELADITGQYSGTIVFTTVADVPIPSAEG